MRRLLLPAALLAALVAFLLLEPPWRERAESRRAAPAGRGEIATEAAAGGADARTPGESHAAHAEGRVHGVVTGKWGVFFGARVVAYRPDGEDVLATAYTNPKGEYALDLPAPLDFDLAVEPAPETYLVPVRRRVALRAGEDREEQFALRPVASVSGTLVNADGRGLHGIAVVALRPEDADPSAHPNALRGREVGRCRSGHDGSFRLACLEPGTYALAIAETSWTLRAPALLATDAPPVSHVAVPAASVDLDVRDVETGVPVGAFSVKASVGSRVLIEEAGKDGILARRVPTDQPPYGVTFPSVEVGARGFRPFGPMPLTREERQTVWLLPEREPNTTIRVLFDDGRPYLGGLIVNFASRSGKASGSVPFSRIEDGVFRGAMPHGEWSLVVWLGLAHGQPRRRGADLERTAERLLVFGEPRRTPVDVEVAAGRDAEVTLTLEAGGTLVILPPPGAERAEVFLRDESERERGSQGRTYAVSGEGVRIEGVPPDLYQVGYAKVRRDADGHGRELVWFRDVRVVVGGTEEIRLPPP